MVYNISEFFSKETIFELSNGVLKEVNLSDVFRQEEFLKVFEDGHAEDRLSLKYYFMSKKKGEEFVMGIDY